MSSEQELWQVSLSCHDRQGMSYFSELSPSQNCTCPCLQWFSAIDADRSGQLDAEELQKALVSPCPRPDICTVLSEVLTGHDVLAGAGEPAFQPDCLLTHHKVRLYPTLFRQS